MPTGTMPFKLPSYREEGRIYKERPKIETVEQLRQMAHGIGKGGGVKLPQSGKATAERLAKLKAEEAEKQALYNAVSYMVDNSDINMVDIIKKGLNSLLGGEAMAEDEVLTRKLFAEKAQHYANGGPVSPGLSDFARQAYNNWVRPAVEDARDGIFGIYDAYNRSVTESDTPYITRVPGAVSRAVESGVRSLPKIPEYLGRKAYEYVHEDGFNKDLGALRNSELGKFGDALGERTGEFVHEYLPRIPEALTDLAEDTVGLNYPQRVLDYYGLGEDEPTGIASELKKVRKEHEEKKGKQDATGGQKSTTSGKADPIADALATSETLTIEEKQSLADRLGIDVSDPYDNWAWVRDMSAGLLASQEPTLFQAWGDASLYSNEKREAKELWAKEMDAKLKLAEWKLEEEKKAAELEREHEINLEDIKLGNKMEVARYEAALEGGGDGVAGKYYRENCPNGMCHKITKKFDGLNHMLLSPNWRKHNVDQDRVVTIGSEDWYVMDDADVYLQQQKDAQYDKFKTEHKNRVLDHFATTVYYKDEPLFSIETNKEFGQEQAEAYQAAEKARQRLIAHMKEGVTPENRDDVNATLNFLLTDDAMRAVKFAHNKSGRWTDITQQDKAELIRQIDNKATVMFNDKNSPFYQDWQNAWVATAYDLLPKVNWDLPGANKFKFDLSEPDYKESDSTWEDIHPSSLVPFGKVTMPQGPGIPEEDDKWLYREDESPRINDTQFELLPPSEQDNIKADASIIARQLVEAEGISMKEALNKTIYWLGKYAVKSGEDVGGWTDYNSKYVPFTEWWVEPKSMKNSREVEGMVWNPYKGYYVNKKGKAFKLPPEYYKNSNSRLKFNLAR